MADWLMSEDERLIELLELGVKRKQMSKILGRTIGAICGRVARLKVEGKIPEKSETDNGLAYANEQFLALLHEHHPEQFKANGEAFDDELMG